MPITQRARAHVEAPEVSDIESAVRDTTVYQDFLPYLDEETLEIMADEELHSRVMERMATINDTIDADEAMRRMFGDDS